MTLFWFLVDMAQLILLVGALALLWQVSKLAPLYRTHELEAALAGVRKELRRLNEREAIAMGITEDLIAAVTRNTTAVGGVLEYLKSLPPEATVADAIAHLNDNSAQLERAFTANVEPQTP